MAMQGLPGDTRFCRDCKFNGLTLSGNATDADVARAWVHPDRPCMHPSAMGDTLAYLVTGVHPQATMAQARSVAGMCGARAAWFEPMDLPLMAPDDGRQAA